MAHSKSYYMKLLLTMGSALALSACTSAKSTSTDKDHNAISWMTTSEIQTLDQSKMVDTTSGEQAKNVFEGLYRVVDGGKVVPGVAKSSKVSKDGLTWTFYLRKNAKWSDGSPVTAQDFVFSLRRTLDPKTKSQQQNFFQAVKNANDVVAGKKNPRELGVEAKSSHILVVHLTHPVPYFKKLEWNPENQNAVKKYGNKYGTASKYMVYNGPFVSKGWSGTNLSWKLVKNKYYWDAKDVKLDQVNYTVVKTPSTDYNMYQSGKLDGAYLDTQASKELKNQSDYQVFKLDRTEYLTFNVSKNKLLANADFRRAVSMALDRKTLANTVGAANTVATTFVGPQDMADGKNFNAYAEKLLKNKKFTTYDKSLANLYLNKALKSLGKNKVEFTLAGDDDDISKKVMEYIQSQLESTFNKKVMVNVHSMPKTSRVSQMLNGDYEVDYTGLTSGYTDPYSMLSVMRTGENYNFGRWSNNKFDNALNESNREMNSKQRLNYLVEAAQVMNDEQPLSPLFHDGQAWMVKKNIHNLEFSMGSFSFRNVYVGNK
ncbi:oligopeptide transport system substrate-binding protein [Lactobacillus colini]|uniref:Oligopeptide transport system substrate-binding protein n=1 Tax=Lactobacillus colini TaxID=1819254 RepID=A0ABS4MBP7_9LACO|nr:peptide ABC transporter substrate-binding protein [Lactobacillus colini]MBP2057089.1 oligopeptide transport system substrate-binding protein [Lactobacillus colini]